MQTQAVCPALPCRRGPGSGHPGRQPLQTGPPRLSLFTQHTGRLPCEQRGGECQGEGGSPLGPPFPAGACCGGPTPLRAGPRPGGKQHSLSFPPRTAPWNPIAHSPAQGLLGPVQKGPAAICPSPLTDTSLQGGLTVTCPPGCGGGRRAGRQLGGARLPSATTLQTGLTGSRALPPPGASW